MAFDVAVEAAGDHFALDRPLHVGHFFGPLVDQEHDQLDFRVIVEIEWRCAAEHDRLAGPRRGDDQGPLALAERSHDVDDARREILLGRILVFHLQPLIRIERRQVVEIDLVARLFGVLEIERVHLQEREVPLALFRAADVAVNGIARAQAEAADCEGDT